LPPQIPLPLEISLAAGQVLRVDIPLIRVAAIEGLVFNDANRNGLQDVGEKGIPKVRVLLTGEISRETITDAAGRFVFADLMPGQYKVKIDEKTLPERFELTTSPELTVTVAPGERVFISFGAAEKPPIIKFAPIADFIFTPEKPKVGEKVIFDASASYDPDGQIVKYEWDFESDGIIDATGKIVEHVFLTPGRYPVKLTITDNDGNKDSVAKVVTVSD